MGKDGIDPSSTEATLQAVQFTLKFLDEYRGPEKDGHPFLILKALATLSKSYLDDGVLAEKVRFDTADVFDKAQELGHVPRNTSGDKAKWVSSSERELQKLLPETGGSQAEIAEKYGFQFVPRVRKDRGGGRAKQSQYWIEAEPAPKTESGLDNLPEKRSHSEIILYTPERRKVPLLVRPYVGRILTRPRIVILALIFLVLWLSGWWYLQQGILSKPFYLIVSMVFFGGAAYFWPLYQIMRWRTIPNPEVLQAVTESEPTILEMVETPAKGNGSRKQIQLVRYTGECLICQGRVVVESGGRDFRGRLVGRCQRSPREHVFSFDHVTRAGEPLRYRPLVDSRSDSQ